ncbi:MAG TPA: EamA family transporter [bacterium]|jgi:drug/metabolite transporter (DMT)-like permease
MTYLVLAVLVQVTMASLLKIGELYRQDRLVVMGFNYLAATVVTVAAWAVQGSGVPGTATLVLGTVAGVFYAMGLFVWMGAIATVGLGTSTAALRLSVLWPTFLSLLVFGERPAPAQLTGVALTFGVLGLLAAHSLRVQRARPGQGGLGWVLATFTINGGAGVCQKLFTELAPPVEKMALLALIFATATLVTGAPMLKGRRRLRRGDVVRGLAFGLGNVCSNTFLLMGLERVAGAVAFPFASVGTILLTSLSGIVLWRERPGLLGSAAIALAAVSVVLMLR